MIKTGIINGITPSAGVLLSILLNHPDVDVRWVTGPVGKGVTELHPSLMGETRLDFTDTPDWEHTDIVFIVAEDPKIVIPENVKVIDLTGNRNYTEDGTWVYGLAEWNRKAMVRGATRVTIPGPLAQAVILALLPLASRMMLPNDDINVAAVVNHGESLTVNAPALERQKKEIERTLAEVQPGTDFNSIGYSTFTGDGRPGALAVVDLPMPAPLESLHALYEEFYSDHNFTHLSIPSVKPGNVRGTNKCLIHLEDNGAGRLVITTALDPRRKGSVGTAIHALNLLFGLHERTALR